MRNLTNIVILAVSVFIFEKFSARPKYPIIQIHILFTDTRLQTCSMNVKGPKDHPLPPFDMFIWIIRRRKEKNKRRRGLEIRGRLFILAPLMDGLLFSHCTKDTFPADFCQYFWCPKIGCGTCAKATASFPIVGTFHNWETLSDRTISFRRAVFFYGRVN